MFRFDTRRVVAAGCAAAAGVAGLVVAAGAADATPTMTVTGLSVHRLPASTSNQLITISGTNFSEAAIASIAINGCTAAGTYVVTSATSIAYKTGASCATTSTGVVTLTPATGYGSAITTVPSTTGGKFALVFVAAPTLAANDTTTFPVVTANTAGQATPVTTASASGGVAVKVTSGTTGFVSSTAYPLAATMDGYKLANVKLVGTSGTAGNAFTATLPAIPATASPALAITSNGVSKSFAYAAADSSSPVANSFEFTIAGVSITVSPAFGPRKGGNVLVVKGSGFTASTTVSVGGTSCPVVSGSVKATQVSCTAPAVTTSAPKTVTTTTSGVTSVVSSGSTYTYVD